MSIEKDILSQSWMDDVSNDWVKTQAIIDRISQLLNRLRFEVKRENIKAVANLTDQLSICHLTLKELWGIK